MKQEKASGGLRRFFRRYLVTGVGILLLFILANVLMLGTLSSVIYGRMSDGADAPVDALAACVSGKAGDYTVDEPAFAALAGRSVVNAPKLPPTAVSARCTPWQPIFTGLPGFFAAAAPSM